jgi:hypothetical protein
MTNTNEDGLDPYRAQFEAKIAKGDKRAEMTLLTEKAKRVVTLVEEGFLSKT